MRYVVMCEKSGGVTGYGCTEQKKGGQVQYFDTKEEADTVARQRSKEMNHAYATSSYRFWSEPRY